MRKRHSYMWKILGAATVRERLPRNTQQPTPHGRGSARGQAGLVLSLLSVMAATGCSRPPTQARDWRPPSDIAGVPLMQTREVVARTVPLGECRSTGEGANQVLSCPAEAPFAGRLRHAQINFLPDPPNQFLSMTFQIASGDCSSAREELVRLNGAPQERSGTPPAVGYMWKGGRLRMRSDPPRPDGSCEVWVGISGYIAVLRQVK